MISEEKKKTLPAWILPGYKSLRDRSASPRHCETETRLRPKTLEAVTRPRPQKRELQV